MDTSTSVSLLKADRSGRVQVPAERKRQIQNLYRVKATLREKRADPQLREAVRGTESWMVVQRLRWVPGRMRPKTLPKSLLG